MGQADPFDPDVHRGGEGEIELRQVFELEDFAPGEAVEHHRELQKRLAKDARSLRRPRMMEES